MYFPGYNSGVFFHQNKEIISLLAKRMRNGYLFLEMKMVKVVQNACFLSFFEKNLKISNFQKMGKIRKFSNKFFIFIFVDKKAFFSFSFSFSH